MKHAVRGFTLIELSIVLVIIGLIVGGVLVGQNLISAAAVRAQISQIEKYQTATNTFRGKYGYLPGDIPNPYAVQFGFALRGTSPGQGDGNGIIQGGAAFMGEQGMFWVDLTTAKLIDGSFSTATPTFSMPSDIPQTQVGLYFPQSKIGNNGYVYIWSGGWTGGDGINYFSLTGVTGGTAANTSTTEIPLLTVAQAYSIDKKVDDGKPQTGSVTAMSYASLWASAGPYLGNPPQESLTGDFDQTNLGPITPGTTNPWWDTQNGATNNQTCYNNTTQNVSSPEHYSMEYNSGAGVNCWLSFMFQ
jgi:prepilin-type N-terminal cleavage/methylation domain-containing protein